MGVLGTVSFTWASCLLTLVGSAVAYVVLYALYSVTLHPLAKYPGPFIAKFTNWRDVIVSAKGIKHLDLHQLHQKYGPVVRYGPDAVSFDHPDALKPIYGHKVNTKKSDFYLSFPARPGAVSTHTAIDPKTHARKRRVMSHAFSDAALRGMEEYVLNHLRYWMQNMAGTSTKEWTAPKKVSDWTQWLAFDVMGDLCFGKSFSMLKGDVPETRRATHLLAQAAKRHNTVGPMPWLHQTKLDRIIFPQMNKDRDEYMAFSGRQVGERTKSDIFASKRKDFFYYLLNSKDPETGEGFHQRELWGESNTLIIAGSDTTATTIASTIFYLTRNPHALETVTKEIRNKFDNVEAIKAGPELNSCSYLRACIDEAMRMTPPVGGALPRVVLNGGIEVLGDKLPAGVIVGCPIYALHHNVNFVDEPFTYRPERWDVDAQGSSEASVKALHSVFNPFSVGPRACIGKPMAYMELMLSLGRLIWTYDMQKAPGELGAVGEGRPGMGEGRERAGEFQLEDIFASHVEGPYTQFRMRQDIPTSA
ncbi:cytochrome P450 [Sarocladium strictum]